MGWKVVAMDAVSAAPNRVDQELVDVQSVSMCTCCTFLNGSLLLGTDSCRRLVFLSEAVLHIGSSCHPRITPSYVSCVGTSSYIESKCPSRTGCP